MVTNAPVAPIIDDESLREHHLVVLAGLEIRGLDFSWIVNVIDATANQNVDPFVGLDPDGSKLVSGLADGLLLRQNLLLEGGDLGACTLVDQVVEVGHRSLEQLVHLLLGEVGGLLRRLRRGSSLNLCLLVRLGRVCTVVGFDVGLLCFLAGLCDGLFFRCCICGVLLYDVVCNRLLRLRPVIIGTPDQVIEREIALLLVGQLARCRLFPEWLRRCEAIDDVE